MGSYSNKLSRRLRGGIRPEVSKIAADVERLVAVAIERDGETHSRGFKSHADLRAALGDADPYTRKRTDLEGFMTSKGRFVTRREAKDIALSSGQIAGEMRRDLLSSDIDW